MYDRYGPPDVLRLVDVERPILRDDEVLVRIHAAAVTRGDCATRDANRPSGLAVALLSRFIFGIRRPRQRILGSEFAGEVEAVGASVRAFAVGDRVFGTSGLRMGAHAEFVCLPERGALASLPAGTTFEEAAAICDGGLNALTALRRVALGPGQRLLIYGASGSIGTAAVQLARSFDAHVSAVCGTRNVELVRSLGADEVIDYRREDFGTRTDRYDVIFDAVGKLAFTQSRRSLKAGGIFIATDGPLNAVLGRVTAWTGGRRVVFPIPRQTQANVRFLKELIEARRYRAVIDRVYPLEDVVDATRHVETGHKTGNVVLAIGTDRAPAP